MPQPAMTTLASTSTSHAALTTPPATASVVPTSPQDAQSVPRMLSADAVPVSSVVHPHPMRSHGAVGFQQLKLYIAATVSPIPKSVWAALADPHWWTTMEEEYATLMSNDTWDLVPRPRITNFVIGKWIFKHKLKVDRDTREAQGPLGSSWVHTASRCRL
jgi:hypothetical protein